jgi:hypothetical protein
VTEIKKSLTIENELEGLEAISDGIIDAMYILLGTAHEYGIADRLPLMFDEVHNANMRKLDENGKPWSPPNLKIILNRKFHLYSESHATFAADLQAIREAEAKKFNKEVESAIFRRLKWYHRILPRISQVFEWAAKKLEAPTKKHVKVIMSTDKSYRGVAEIEVYGERSEIVDY